MYIYMYTYMESIHISLSLYIYLYAGLRPLPLAPKLEDSMIGRFDGLLTASHLYPIGGSRACLLRSILASGLSCRVT